MELYEEHNIYLDESRQWGTDKLTKHPYTKCYDKIFEPIRNDPIKMLEIGVYHGASLILWSKYFVNGDITGVDIEARKSFENIKDRVDENKVRIIIADAYQKEVADTFSTYDIIMDDGPHSLDSMKSFIELYWSKVNKDGYLIIEDIPDHTWLQILSDMIKGGNVDVFDYSTEGGASDSRLLVAKKV